MAKIFLKIRRLEQKVTINDNEQFFFTASIADADRHSSAKYRFCRRRQRRRFEIDQGEESGCESFRRR